MEGKRGLHQRVVARLGRILADAEAAALAQESKASGSEVGSESKEPSHLPDPRVNIFRGTSRLTWKEDLEFSTMRCFVVRAAPVVQTIPRGRFVWSKSTAFREQKLRRFHRRLIRRATPQSSQTLLVLREVVKRVIDGPSTFRDFEVIIAHARLIHISQKHIPGFQATFLHCEHFFVALAIGFCKRTHNRTPTNCFRSINCLAAAIPRPGCLSLSLFFLSLRLLPSQRWSL